MFLNFSLMICQFNGVARRFRNHISNVLKSVLFIKQSYIEVDLLSYSVNISPPGISIFLN